MSSFFTVPAAQRKRKRTDGPGSVPKRSASTGTTRTTKQVRKQTRDESISGSDSEDDDGPRQATEDDVDSDSGSGSESEDETAAERRLRLAERYLENIKEEVDEVGFDAEDIDRDLIAERLRDDAAESKGRIYRNLASELSFKACSHSLFRSNTETVTAVATCPPYAYTVSKDICLVKWRIQDTASAQLSRHPKKAKRPPPPVRRKPTQVAYAKGNKNKAKDHNYQGHVDSILCVAASQDGKYVVTGGLDRRIIVWDAEILKPVRVFTQHRDAVTGLAFRRGTNQLYSSSKDRTLKIWSLDELAYVETLFGHQDEVVDVAALAQERCISVGARDRTARLWKVVEETQLVFRGGGGTGEKRSRGGSSSHAPKVHEGSMDRVAMIDEDMFVTGSDNGSISLWIQHKKKPIFTIPLAHGVDPPLTPEQASAEQHPNASAIPAPQPRWITALKTIPYSDVILSGSWDGNVRVWKVSEDRKKIEAIGIVGTSPQVIESAASAALSVIENDSPTSNSFSPTLSGEEADHQQVVRGVVNDISVFERGDKGKEGVCIVAAIGKEHRLGRWKKLRGRNGAIVFEVARVDMKKAATTEGKDEDEDMDS